MERQKHYAGELRRQMERFLMVDETGGSVTYSMQRKSGPPVDLFTYIAFFPRPLGQIFPQVIAGELNGDRPLTPQYVRGLMNSVELPLNPQAKDRIFRIGRNPHSPSETLNTQMPSTALLFVPPGIMEEGEAIFLKIISNLDPEKALEGLKESFEAGLSQRN